MTFIRKDEVYTYYTGISTDPWSYDYSKRKVYASKEDAEAALTAGGDSHIVGIITDVYVPF